jgi:uncharacterized membrane protein YeaQ/YmgE (transglycosylase-associated protein family)
VGIFSWILFGLLAGVVAELLMPGKDPGGIIITIGLGVLGAIVGGYLGHHLLGTGDWQSFHFDLRSFALAVGGALLLLIAYRMFKSQG